MAAIDLHTLWQCRPNDRNMNSFLRGFFNFEFCPAPLDELSLCPLPSEARRSVVARVIYKVCVRVCVCVLCVLSPDCSLELRADCAQQTGGAACDLASAIRRDSTGGAGVRLAVLRV